MANGYGTNLKTGAIIEIILPILATIGISLRFYIRYLKKIAVKWDDYFILLSLPLSWALWAIWLHITISLVPHSVSTMPLENLSKFLMWLWIHDLFNVVAVMLIKISIILFYFRAFATTRKAKYWLYAILVLNIIQFIMRLANVFVSCIPLKDTWENPWKCGENHEILRILTLVTESFGLATEIMLLVYPFPFVWKSHLVVSKKLALCVVFFTGFVACATQAVRMFVLETYLYHPSDFGRDVTAPTLVLCALFETSLGSFIISIVAIWGPVREGVRNVFRKMKGLSPINSPESTMPASSKRSRTSYQHGGVTLGSLGTDATTLNTMTQTSTILHVEKKNELSSSLAPIGVVIPPPAPVTERSGLMTPLPDDEEDVPWGKDIGRRGG